MAVPNNSLAANSAPPRGIHAELPLDPSRREIRVLDLKASRGDNGSLWGILRVVSLAESPDFTALSYVWGTPSGTQDYQIEVNHGRKLGLTRNCFQALKQLRENFGNMTIWVDSLCINQDDIAEKSSQIPLMGEIYTWARTVYIWLGVGSRESYRAIDWFWQHSHHNHRLAGLSLVAEASGIREKMTVSLKLAHTVLVSLLYYPGDKRDKIDQDGVERLTPSALGCRLKSGRSPSFDACVLELLTHPWFDRAWTFQELVLAWDPVFLCGRKQLNWDVLVSAAECLRPSEVRSCLKIPLVFYTRPTQDDTMTERLDVIQSMYSFWMDVPRPTKWNGVRKRNPLHDGQDAVSALEYRRLLRGKKRIYWWFHFIYLTSMMSGVLLHGFCELLPRFISMLMFASTPNLAKGIFIAVLIMLVDRLGNLLLDIIADWLFGIVYPVSALPPSSTASSLTSQSARGMNTVHRQGPRSAVASSVGPHSIHGPTRLRSKHKEHSATVHGLIRALRYREATVPADRAHAVRGIISSLGAPHTGEDYSLDKDEVCTQLLGDLLHWSPEFIVTIMDARLPGVDQPSWVPRWDHRPSPGWVRDAFFQITEEASPLLLHLNATRGSVAYAQVDGRKLTVRGHALDRVKWTSEEMLLVSEADFGGSSPSSSSPVLELLKGLLLMRPADTLSRLPNEEVFARACMMYNVFWLWANVDWESKQFEPLLKLMKRWASRVARYPPRDIEEAAVEFYSEIRAQYKAMAGLIELCQIIGKKREIFFTENGLPGTGASVMKAGHEIYLISGVPLPVILQPDDTVGTGKGPYQVVSACFVVGAMDGTSLKEELVEELVLI